MLIRTAVLCLFLSSLVAGRAANAGTISSGHLDLDLDYSGGAGGDLTLTWRTYNPMSSGTPTNDDDYPFAGNPALVPITNTYTVPSSSSFACLGAARSTVYRLKQSEDTSQVWLGYNTQGIASSQFVNDKVALQVSLLSGPTNGRFIAYTTNALGAPTYLFNTTAGACNLTSFPGGVTTGIHNHAWWAFSEPGTYVLRFVASGTLTPANGGGAKTTGNVDVTFVVQ